MVRLMANRAKINSLNLAGDGDDIDLLEDVERVFGIEVSDAEASDMETVGQLHELICNRIDVRADAACLSATVFRKLVAGMDGIRVRPQTRIDEAIEPKASGEVLRKLENATGLKLFIRRHPASIGVSTVLTFAFPALVVASWSTLGNLAFVWLLGWLAVPRTSAWSDAVFGKVPPRVETVGELVTQILPENYSTLAASGVTGNRGDVWKLLVLICSEYAPGGIKVTPETTFFRA